jgi:hypothetical protein
VTLNTIRSVNQPINIYNNNIFILNYLTPVQRIRQDKCNTKIEVREHQFLKTDTCRLQLISRRTLCKKDFELLKLSNLVTVKNVRQSLITERQIKLSVCA